MEDGKVSERGWQALQWVAIGAALLLPVLENLTSRNAVETSATTIVPVALRATVAQSSLSSKILLVHDLDAASSRPREYVVDTRQLRLEFRFAGPQADPAPRRPASALPEWSLQRVERRTGGGDQVEPIEVFSVAEGDRSRLSNFFELAEGRNEFEAVFRQTRNGQVRRVPFVVRYSRLP